MTMLRTHFFRIMFVGNLRWYFSNTVWTVQMAGPLSTIGKIPVPEDHDFQPKAHSNCSPKVVASSSVFSRLVRVQGEGRQELLEPRVSPLTIRYLFWQICQKTFQGDKCFSKDLIGDFFRLWKHVASEKWVKLLEKVWLCQLDLVFAWAWLGLVVNWSTSY